MMTNDDIASVTFAEFFRKKTADWRKRNGLTRQGLRTGATFFAVGLLGFVIGFAVGANWPYPKRASRSAVTPGGTPSVASAPLHPSPLPQAGEGRGEGKRLQELGTAFQEHRKDSAPVPADYRHAMDRAVKDLLQSMLEDVVPPGFRVIERHAERFHEQPGSARMLLIKTYEGASLTGLVLEIENLSDEPIGVNPSRSEIPGYIAGTAKHLFLAPKTLNQTTARFSRYPNKTTAYLVLSNGGRK